MRNYRRMKAARARGGSNQDFWLSFSDLMSVLVLVFILVMFYILYKYFVIYSAYEDELSNMLVIQAALDEKEAELNSAQTELSDREAELAEQQLMLELAQEAMADSEEELAAKQAELDDALLLIDEREQELADMEDKLNSQQAKLDEQQLQLEALVGVRSRIIQEMSDSLRANNITATVDPDTGAIMLASDVLFEYGSSELSDSGKAFIDDFLPVYLSVLFSEENAGYVSEIIIEGHTDTTDTYIKNLGLSQDRALAVAEYVLADDYRGLTTGQKTQFKSLLTANGRSYSDPILDENGNVDAAASRRVVFKFRLTDDEMIQQMRDILEESSNDEE